jgi:hypothetical protein
MKEKTLAILTLILVLGMLTLVGTYLVSFIWKGVF